MTTAYPRPRRRTTEVQAREGAADDRRQHSRRQDDTTDTRSTPETEAQAQVAEDPDGDSFANRVAKRFVKGLQGTPGVFIDRKL